MPPTEVPSKNTVSSSGSVPVSKVTVSVPPSTRPSLPQTASRRTRSSGFNCTRPVAPHFKPGSGTLRVGMFQLNIHAASLSETFLPRLIKRLKRIEQYYGQLLGASYLKPVKATLYIFADPQSFEQSLQNRGMDHDVAGNYSGRTGVISMRRYDQERTLSLATHEIVHAVNHALIGRTPGWLNEGLAEFFEHLTEGADGRLTVQSASWLTRGGELKFDPLDVSDVLHSETYWYEDAVADNSRLYASSWLFIKFLMASSSGRSALATVVRAEKQKPCSLIEADVMQQLLIDVYQDIEVDYRQWQQEVHFYP